jgi:hypothetical protein
MRLLDCRYAALECNWWQACLDPAAIQLLETCFIDVHRVPETVLKGVYYKGGRFDETGLLQAARKYI